MRPEPELAARRVLKVSEASTVDELRTLVERYLEQVEDVRKDSWWMEARAALYRLTALAAVATENGIPIDAPRTIPAGDRIDLGAIDR